MSGDSEVPDIKLKESENVVSEKSENKEKKLKRNYCYVCEVQCTAVKNYLEHQKGKKHLKKLSLVKEIQKKSRKKLIIHNNIKKNPTKKTVKSSNSTNPGGQNSNKSESHKISDSHSGVDNSENTTMDNFDRQTPRHRKHYINSNYQNNYSRYQNAKYSYSNSYGRQGYFNGPQYPAHSRWDAPQYSNAPNNYNNYGSRQEHRYFTDMSYMSHENEYFSAFGHDFNSHDSLDNRPLLPVTSAESESSAYKSSKNKNSENMQSNSVSSENANKSSSKDHPDCMNSSSEITDSKQSTSSSSNLNQSSISIVGADKDEANTSVSPQVSNTCSSKVRENKRIRSQSLSSCDNLNNEKRLKDKTDSQSLDSDGISEEQKLKEYTTSLLETNPNRISRIIQHPSNYKEKAVLNHIMTNFSRSRRNENLTRKLRSNSLESAGNDVMSEDAQCGTLDADDVIILPSEVTSDETTIDSDKNKKCIPVKKTKKNSAGNNNFNAELNDDNSIAASVTRSSKKSNKVDGKSNEINLSTSSKKSLEKRKEKSSVSVSLEKSVKRKNPASDTSSKGKKQKLYDTASFESPSTTRITEEQNLNNDTSTESLFIQSSSAKATNSITLSDVLPVREEVADSIDVNPQQNDSSTAENLQNAQNQILDFNSEISVETLIQLFASGNVMVKKEFNDPAIDAIKAINPDELINACSNESLLNKVSETPQLESNVQGSTSEPNLMNTVRENTNCISPVILGSAVISDNSAPVSMTRTSSPALPSPSCEKSKDQNSSLSNSVQDDCILTGEQRLDLINRTKSEFPHLHMLISKLQEIASQEETVKQNLSEAKSKINEYQTVLDEWKNKKKRLQDEEEDLRVNRNDIITLMQNAVKTNKSTSSEESQTASLTDMHSATDQRKTVQMDKTVPNTTIVEANKSSKKSFSSSTPASSPNISQKQKKKSTSSESDEITILPSPVKPKPPEIIIFDDDVTMIEGSKNSSGYSGGGLSSSMVTANNGSNVYDSKSWNAHSTVINCLVVFDEFLYTCSNDSTAKRFSLKDFSHTITYLHTAKNVMEIAVEKVQSEALVFTSCSNRVISLFIASNGTKIKTFFQPCSIMSICKGWGKFYAGLTTGIINVYNWKYEEKEIVQTQSSVYHINTAHQGRLHILVILASDGNIALRDAETGLLIRLITTTLKLPSCLTVHNDLAYLGSSDKTLSILDIMSGKVEKKFYLTNHTTGLAAYEDNIFTISYSGLVTCYNRGTVIGKKVYYGAGKNGLTCIYVYQDRVFTGNRKGDVSFFKFDPISSSACKFGSCNVIYGLKKDLEFHVEKDHLLKKKNLIQCCWSKCTYRYPSNYTVTDKMSHLKMHIHNLPFWRKP